MPEGQERPFDNQKQLRVGERDPSWAHLSGDESADNRIDVNDSEDNLDFRDALPLGWPFMHPMHDATADPQLPDQPDKDNARDTSDE